MIGLILATIITITGDTRTATISTANSCGEGHGNRHAWTATASGTATVVMCGTPIFDTLLEVRRAGAYVACNDDTNGVCPGGAKGSKLAWPALAGVEYDIYAIAYGSDADGPYTLTLETSGVADVCPSPPNFTLEPGGVCTQARQALPCACSEAIQWTPTDNKANRFEVRRRENGTSTWTTVGRAPTLGRPGPSEEEPVRYELANWYMPLEDQPPPRTGILYSYTVLACNQGGCSAQSAELLYTPPPLECYAATGKVTCP